MYIWVPPLVELIICLTFAVKCWFWGQELSQWALLKCSARYSPCPKQSHWWRQI